MDMAEVNALGSMDGQDSASVGSDQARRLAYWLEPERAQGKNSKRHCEQGQIACDVGQRRNEREANSIQGLTSSLPSHAQTRDIRFAGAGSMAVLGSRA